MQDPFIIMVNLLNSKIQELQDKINEMEDVQFTLRGEVSALELEKGEMRLEVNALALEKAELAAFNRGLRDDIQFYMEQSNKWRDKYDQGIQNPPKPPPTPEEVTAKLNAFLCTDEYKDYIKRGSKIGCIKAVRDLSQWGLREAKDWTDKAFKEYPEGKTAEPPPDPCPICGEDRNHPSQYGKHSC